MLLFCFLIFFGAFLLTWLMKVLAVRKSLLDIPNDRSSHKVPTPRGGGLSIAIVWFVFLLFYYVFSKDISIKLLSALLCGIPIAFIGLIDDIFTVSPKIRFSVQFVFAILAVFFLGGLPSISLGFTNFNSPLLLSIISVFGIVWFTNLFNFLDGIDGYIGSEVIFIFLSAFIFFGFQLPLFFAAAVAGFLIWNWQPAKIFMGDVGSTLLGFTIGVFALHYQNTSQSSIIIWLMLTSVFWFDATLTLFRRWRNHEQLSKAHKKHAYQRIVQSGFSHQKTVLYSLSINFSILGLIWLSIKIPYLLIPVFIVNIIYLYILIRVVDSCFPFTKYKNYQSEN